MNGLCGTNPRGWPVAYVGYICRQMFLDGGIKSLLTGVSGLGVMRGLETPSALSRSCASGPKRAGGSFRLIL